MNKICLIIILGLTPLFSYAEGTFLHLGTGAELRTDMENSTLFVTLGPESQFNMRTGYLRTIYKMKDFDVLVGGGLAYSEYTFDFLPAIFGEVNGFRDITASDIHAFVQVDFIKPPFFVSVFYSEMAYIAHRNRIINYETTIINGVEYLVPIRDRRIDNYSNSDIGTFIGVRIPIK